MADPKGEYMRTMLMSILYLILAVPPLFADGECPERPASAQEYATYQAVYGAAKAAVPSAPIDWVVKDETDTHAGSTVPKCQDGPNDRPLYYRIKFTYEYSREASDRVQQTVVSDALKGTPAQQVKLAELDRKIEALEAAKKEARKNRDAEEKQRAREELKDLNRERHALKDEINNAYMERAMSGKVAAEINKNRPVLENAELVIKVNERSAWVPVKDTPVQVPGAAQAYWCRQDDNGGRLVILLGAWDGNFKSKLPKTAVVTKARNMVIEISGERQMAENLAKQLKLDLLKKQL